MTKPSLSSVIARTIPTEAEMVEIRARALVRAQTNPNCFTHWFPAVVSSGARVPRSLILPFDRSAQMEMAEWGPGHGGEALAHAVEEIRTFGKTVGYPLFLKNSLYSGKHSWEKTCFIASADAPIEEHVARISFEWAMLGNVDALYYIAREFIPTAPAFTAFSGTPITPEFRVFARNGVMEAWQPYWPAEAIKYPSVEHWREALAEISVPTDAEMIEMKSLSGDVTRRLGGFWSVDFLRDRDGQLWLIDMATGESSYVSPHRVAV